MSNSIILVWYFFKTSSYQTRKNTHPYSLTYPFVFSFNRFGSRPDFLLYSRPERLHNFQNPPSHLSSLRPLLLSPKLCAAHTVARHQQQKKAQLSITRSSVFCDFVFGEKYLLPKLKINTHKSYTDWWIHVRMRTSQFSLFKLWERSESCAQHRAYFFIMNFEVGF